jgi:hypothetical protein
VKGEKRRSNAYYIVHETTEDRFDETVSPENAARIARSLVREGQAGEPVSASLNERVK